MALIVPYAAWRAGCDDLRTRGVGSARLCAKPTTGRPTPLGEQVHQSRWLQ
ncbi:MAG: hypothetical protein ABI131_03725 [Nostocoides sp.]